MASCKNCGYRTTPSARFCPRCGAPQKDGARSSTVPFPGRSQEHWDVCEIGWWRGYLKSEFYAIALGPDRREYEVGRSRQFMWRNTAPPPPDHERARAAHDALVQKLVDAGWEPLGEATPWFAQRFRRHTTGLRVLTGTPAEGATDDESLLQP